MFLIFRFLQSRSNAFLSDDYYQSDKDWMDLNSKIEVTIGPYEVNTAHCQLGAASAQETFHPCSGVWGHSCCSKGRLWILCYDHRPCWVGKTFPLQISPPRNGTGNSLTGQSFQWFMFDNHSKVLFENDKITLFKEPPNSGRDEIKPWFWKPHKSGWPRFLRRRIKKVRNMK